MWALVSGVEFASVSFVAAGSIAFAIPSARTAQIFDLLPDLRGRRPFDNVGGSVVGSVNASPDPGVHYPRLTITPIKEDGSCRSA